MDTNILVSLLLFPNQRMNHMMEVILSSHKLVLSSFVVEELKAVIQKKFPTKAAVVDDLLAKMSFDLVYTPEQINEKLFYIRDEKDYPVLYTAMIEDVDILITGDKDFAEIELKRPEILTPAEFMDTYLK